MFVLETELLRDSNFSAHERYRNSSPREVWPQSRLSKKDKKKKKERKKEQFYANSIRLPPASPFQEP
ncbi:hypothetical protein llap_6230 [Limosa lapponica baueri]|uniref:Uncharacterized protein n=1 Tax=Limosa lapponica baueri TaxID=1758121 RepID=A0A2I0UBP6_LIMLA|nr:hypothetical protein llap_6230 [Limosa lapponica baueri]